MRDSLEKEKKERNGGILHSKIVHFIIIIILGIFAYNLTGIITKVRDTKDNKNQSERKLDELKNQQANLESQIQYLKTDEGKEEVIRDKFRAVKGDEGLIVILPEEDTNEDKKDNSMKEKFSSFLKGIFNKKDDNL